MTKTVDGSGYFLYHSIGMFPGKEALIADGLRKYAHLWSTPDDSQWPAGAGDPSAVHRMLAQADQRAASDADDR